MERLIELGANISAQNMSEPTKPPSREPFDLMFQRNTAIPTRASCLLRFLKPPTYGMRVAILQGQGDAADDGSDPQVPVPLLVFAQLVCDAEC
eukprot:1040474-Rhodomonas_salina.2